VKKISVFFVITVIFISATGGIYAANTNKTYIPVLLYHHFMESDIPKERHSTTITAAQFEEQIKTLTEKGYNSISLSQLEAYLKKNEPLPDNPYMITMDDGYDSNYYYAFPVLRKYNAKAVIFITEGRITEEPGKRWNQNTLVWMTWSQLKEMEDSGLVEVQSHGYIHKPISEITFDEFKESVIKGQETLEANLGERKIKAFAYPYGQKTKEADKFLVKHGYTMQFTTITGTITKKSNKNNLPRITIGYGRTGNDVIKLIRKFR